MENQTITPALATVATLQERAILVSITIAGWSGRIKDKDATADVTSTNHAETGAASVTKALLPKTALAAIKTLDREIREYHYRVTLPWSNGAQMLAAKTISDYRERIEEYDRKRQGLINQLLATYESAKESARYSLGDLWKSEDYPSEEELRSKYSLTYSFDQITGGGDFRVQLDKELMDAIRTETDAAANEHIEQMLLDPYRRVKEVAEKMAERLRAHGEKEPGNKKANAFRDSLIENARDLVAVLPALNLTNDPALEELRQTLQTLASAEPKDLRDNDALRDQTATKAEELVKSLEGIF